ncbi:DNA-3-methyladenine glycosylase I [Pseudomonas oryzihabitans]|uniref:DNA-3-methyladenine glycosylase I n=1 Tax=Pseudomonas oryzihabitans TaxID=47885 RepID=UPI0011A06546|nr:DNA-3-methyladenine glycosylase I [Pseudomonas psychrotolerans]
MRDYSWLLEYALNRCGSPAALEARLPRPVDAAALKAVGDDRYLSLLTRRIFRAGLKHSLVDAKWPAFEEVFFGFDPEKVVLMGGERLERLMQDARLIRHLGKLRSVPINAQMVLDFQRSHGSFGQLLADWPTQDIVGLWELLTKRGNQLGGLSAQRFLRMAGKDTFLATDDVVTALKAQNILAKAPTAKRDRHQMQEAFNLWQEQSGRPLCQLSVMLALTVNH